MLFTVFCVVVSDNFHIKGIQYNDSSAVSYPDIVLSIFVDRTDILIVLSHERDGTKSFIPSIIITDSSLKRTEP